MFRNALPIIKLFLEQDICLMIVEKKISFVD